MIDPDPAVQATSRLVSLRETELLDSPTEASFDRLTRLVSRFLRAPIALVSLVDEDRQFFKSGIGLPEPWASARETPLSHSFCRYVVAARKPLIIADAHNHPLFQTNPGIRELGMVAYLGVPLTTPDGQVLGSLCAIDSQPREWTEDDVATLSDLACSVMTEIQLRREVDDRREAERQLDRYRLLAEHARDVVLFVRSDGRIVEANEAAIAAYGYDRDTLLSMSIFELRDPDTVPFVPGQMALADAQGLTFETIHRRKDGSTFPVEVSSRGAEISGERLLLSILRDISERRRAEEKLRYNERRYRTLIDGVLQLMWVNDPEGRTTYFNRRWQDYVGYDPLTFSVRSWLQVVHADDLPHLLQVRKASIQSGEPYECEYRLCKKDGEFRWHIARVVPMKDRDGRIEHWFGTATDIHDLKCAEAELRAARDAAEAGTRARDQFLAVLSHELRTPLTPVLVSVTALLDDPETPESVRPALEVTKRNIALEARLIDDLLDITRITQGKLNLSREVVDAHELVRRAVEICRDEIGSADLTLTMDLAAQAHHVDADPARLQQIFWNLFKNAVKFTPKGGRVSIRSYNQQDPDGRRLVVEVSDTGVGITAEALPKIFNAFEQGDRAVSRQFGGLGLGLAISQSLTEAHGGSLDASSPGRGQGSTFQLQLPVAVAPAAPVTVPAPTNGLARSPSSLHILLVEDNADTLRVMSRLLVRRGYQVTSASCLALAMEAVEQDVPYNLVVSDIGLPDGSGLDLMRRIRSQRDVKGIALSGYGMEDDVRKSREAGFSLHLTKPVDFPTLEQAIQQMARLIVEEPVES